MASRKLSETLCCRAPLLEKFSLRFISWGTQVAETISPDIFSGQSTLLRSLDLTNVSLPAVTPPAFANITELRYDGPDPSRALLPNMRELVLFTGEHEDNFLIPADHSVLERAAQLHRLTIISVKDGIEERLLEWLPMPQIESVYLSFNSFDGSRAVPQIATHIAARSRSPWCPTTTALYKSLFAARRPPRVRAFGTWRDPFLRDLLPDVMCAVASHITTLRICAYHEPQVGEALCRVRLLPALEELALCLDVLLLECERPNGEAVHSVSTAPHTRDPFLRARWS